MLAALALDAFLAFHQGWNFRCCALDCGRGLGHFVGRPIHNRDLENEFDVLNRWVEIINRHRRQCFFDFILVGTGFSMLILEFFLVYPSLKVFLLRGKSFFFTFSGLIDHSKRRRDFPFWAKPIHIKRVDQFFSARSLLAFHFIGSFSNNKWPSFLTFSIDSQANRSSNLTRFGSRFGIP